MFAQQMGIDPNADGRSTIVSGMDHKEKKEKRSHRRHDSNASHSKKGSVLGGGGLVFVD